MGLAAVPVRGQGGVCCWTPPALLFNRIKDMVKPAPRNRLVGNDAKEGSLLGRTVLRKVVENFYTEYLSRRDLVDGINLDPPGRDLDRECGYPWLVTILHYRRLYDRNAIARKVVTAFPNECWSVYPEVYETEELRVTAFERKWKELNKRIPVCHYLHRADVMSGIGHYGIILLGLDDSSDLSQPVQGIDRKGQKVPISRQKPINLIYLRVFSEDLVKIVQTELDPNNPRFGQPTYYDITFSQPANGDLTLTSWRRVHWSRVVHVTDNREGSEVVGIPRMQPVVDRLLDLRKILGSSGEMFYKGGFPGISFETIPEFLGESGIDEDSVRDQVEEYMNGLKRYLALDGLTAKPLNPQIADPTHHVMIHIQVICAYLDIPVRIFLGSEAGHLASTQDSQTWNKRVQGRQKLYVEPWILNPFITRLAYIGVLPEPEDILVSWQDLNTLSDKDKALVTLQKAQAMMQYVTGGCELIMPVERFLSTVMGLDEDLVKEIMTELKGRGKSGVLTQQMIEPPAPAASPQGGGREGKPAKSPVGRPAGNLPA